MRGTSFLAAIAAALLLATPASAVEPESEPTDPPLGPPVVYEDPVGDVDGEGPDFVSCGASEPWDSLVRFRFEFTSEPPLGYDVATSSTDEMWVGLATSPDIAFPEGLEYILIVHGATLATATESGSGLYDTTQPEGDEVFWGVVDAEVDGAVLTLTVDRKLVGDPETIYFAAAAGSEGEDGASSHDMCPDEEEGPGEYVLVG
jgi:hypothetical protein